MKIDSLRFDEGRWSLESRQLEDGVSCQLVFLFGDSDVLKSEDHFNSIRSLYPNARIAGASSSGNIHGAEISDSPVVAVAVQFERASVAMGMVDFTPGEEIEGLSMRLVQQLPQEGLKHIFVLSDGLNLNGTELVNGINKVSAGVSVTGGMAGDGDRFEQTWVIADAPARQNRILAIGFYGDGLVISSGCHGGWSPFGADRIVTRSVGNVLYELDDEPALDLYKTYLGEFAKDLPHSGMRFPLNIRAADDTHEVIRTLLAIDEREKSITFAGDVPEGYIVRLMKPDIEQLIEGAGAAAEEIDRSNDATALGLVVSCVGRRVVMKQIVEEELEAVEDILGENVQLVGFYSYGEIAPFNDRPEQCQLHNQTMTLTAIYES